MRAAAPLSCEHDEHSCLLSQNSVLAAPAPTAAGATAAAALEHRRGRKRQRTNTWFPGALHALVPTIFTGACQLHAVSSHIEP
jgi:hypothetical protein